MFIRTFVPDLVDGVVANERVHLVNTDFRFVELLEPRFLL